MSRGLPPIVELGSVRLDSFREGAVSRSTRLSADTRPGGGLGVPFAVQLLDDVAEHRPDDADGIADTATGPGCTQDEHARPRFRADDAGDLT